MRELRQIKCPLALAAQFAGVVGHGISGDVVDVGVSLDVVVSCRGRIAAKAHVADSKASNSWVLIVSLCSRINIIEREGFGWEI